MPPRTNYPFEGGVGYEGDIMTAKIMTSQNHRKFIPVRRRAALEVVCVDPNLCLIMNAAEKLRVILGHGPFLEVLGRFSPYGGARLKERFFV